MTKIRDSAKINIYSIINTSGKFLIYTWHIYKAYATIFVV